MIYKYGKQCASLILQKETFFEENKKHVERQNAISQIYLHQPPRTHCKNCDTPLQPAADFVKLDVGYKICSACTHLNGAHEDTPDFCQFVYSSDGGEEYGENYESSNASVYKLRQQSIYTPKAEFLYSSLIEQNEDPSKLRFLDFGAGSGYFVSALSQFGLAGVEGTEVAQSQVEYGNMMLGQDLLSVHALEETNEILSTTKSNVVSFIGVMEHLQDPRGAMRSLSENDAVEYVYLSVPTFSLSVFVEICNPGLFHRHLQGGHTHLYTRESLLRLATDFYFESIAEWWFGSDVVDLYRAYLIGLEAALPSGDLKIIFKDMMSPPMIDALQMELDKKHLGSEVHMLLKKKPAER